MNLIIWGHNRHDKRCFVRKDDKRGSNRKGTDDVLTDGSVVHVYPNMMMLLVDGGKIIDYTAEEGYYTVKNDSAPSMFNGSLKMRLQRPSVVSNLVA